MKETYHYDDLSDTLTIQRTEDVSSVLEANKRAFNDAESRHKSETFNHVARIPTSAIEQWCKQKGVKYQEFFHDEKLLKLFLNDPDNRLFRTRPGRI